MPLDYKDGTPIPFGELDFIYGLDTGELKLRFYFYNNYILGAQKLQIWKAKELDLHKIDCLTQHMGTTSPLAWATKLGAGQIKDTEAKKKGTLSPNSALPSMWASAAVHNDCRRDDRVGFTKWIAATRYNPGLSAGSHQWNARFKRTSKAGLFWALFVKGYNVHFVVNKAQDWDEVVGGSKSTRTHKNFQFTALHPSDGKGVQTVMVEEKRITYSELRWVFRYRDYACVKNRVQFWEQTDTAQTYRPVPAPWLREGKPKQIWADYKPTLKKKDQKGEGDDMAALLQQIDKEFCPKSTQRVLFFVTSADSKLLAVPDPAAPRPLDGKEDKDHKHGTPSPPVVSGQPGIQTGTFAGLRPPPMRGRLVPVVREAPQILQWRPAPPSPKPEIAVVVNSPQLNEKG